MKFNGEGHKDFYEKYGATYESADRQRQALFYLLGVSEETRKHINSIYDFEECCIIPEILTSGWQTSSSRALTALAFDLYHGSPVIPQMDPSQEQIEDALELYSVSGIMSRLHEWLPFALEAINMVY